VAGPHGARDRDLPAVQLELFLEAGASVASQAVRARASGELVQAILRRAGEQATAAATPEGRR
jgi:trimethylamine:corrinoid methyltransferase-like protein